MEQIERDKLLSLQLFDEINLRSPADASTMSLAEKGAAAAAAASGVSMKQIMAEQMCEQYQKDRSKKAASSAHITTETYLAEVSTSTSNSSPALLSRQNKNENSLANMIKLKQMKEKYENVVDSKMIEEVLEMKK